MNARIAAALCVSRRRSAMEWNCPREEVTVRYLGGSVYEAAGCGERATYVCDNIKSMGPYGPMPGRGRTRCVLERRDGYARDSAPPPLPQQQSRATPGRQP